jgi:hypothetical protein
MTTQYEWLSYGGTARLLLAIILLAAAGVAAYTGTRLRRPVPVPRPGRTLTRCMLLTWVLAIGAFLVGFAVYVRQVRLDHLVKAQPANPITMVTGTAAVVLFLIVFSATPRDLWGRLSCGVIAAMGAPWIFEVPFDLIIMTRTNPAVPPDPALYRALFFAPLVLVGLSTLALLRVPGMVKLSRPACCCLALMLLVFAAWALTGFGYPATAIPFVMNVASKILAFVTGLSLFFPEWFTPWRRGSFAQKSPIEGGVCANDAARQLTA